MQRQKERERERDGKNREGSSRKGRREINSDKMLL
jgi:hypothetical protein